MREFLNLIINFHKKKLFNDALKEINLYEQNNNLDPILLNLKGLTLWLLNNFEEALVCYNQALDILKKNNTKSKLYVSILNNKGLAYLKLAKDNQAINEFKTVIECDPNFSEAYNNIGLAYKNLGKKDEALKFFTISNNKDQNFVPARENLIHALSFSNEISDINNLICKTNLEIKQINNKNIFDLVNESNNIIDKYLGDISLRTTQTFRRGGINLNCERHKKIFEDHKIIPEYCFGCFKISIEIQSVLELIKLHIFFDNLYLENGNVKKCMIETRKGIGGLYKGFIYCKTLKEAENLLKLLNEKLKMNISKNLNLRIKRGCTEFALKFKKYNNLKNQMVYETSWRDKEKINDLKFPFLKNNISDRKTTPGINLNDILTIRNWVYFAYLKNDESYKFVSSKIYRSKYIENLASN